MKTVFTGGDATFRGGNDVMRLTLGPSSMAVVHGEEHLQTRKEMLPFLQGKSVCRYERLVRSLAGDMVASWPLDRAFSIFPYTQKLTLEVILQAVIGVSRAAQREALLAAMPKFVDIGSLTELIWVAPWLGRFGPWKRYLAAMRHADSLLLSAIEERRRDPDLGEKEDVLSLLVKERAHLGDQDDDWLRDQLVTLILAGHDTTASGLAWAIDLLLRNPDVLEEAREAAREGDTAYMNALVREVLRIRPVVFQVARHLEKPVVMGGHRLPPGVMVAPAIGLIHASAAIHSEPERFRPSRFCEEDERTPYHWIPFGGGIRRCPGAAFASMEMRIVLEEILQRAELVAVSPRPEKPRPRHINSMPARGTRVVLRRRLAPREAVAAG